MDIFSKIISFHITVFCGVLLTGLVVWSGNTLFHALSESLSPVAETEVIATE